jgi:ABC-type multidrug transport system ATPase subunit
MKLLRQVEMEQYAKRKPNELSGGQKQRVAIARALIKNPEIIMADEPTGALDSNTGKQVMDTLKELSKTKLVIVVSHDREFAEIYGDRIIELKDGKVLHDITKKEIAAEETKSGIKIIDNDIVYIKKGQEVSPGELKTITDIINERSKNADTFISFNKDANDKLKEGAKINDSGNKEKFVDTEQEDIKIKQYNPNSLKLIKSRLGFMDSLKMGASALKNKVGKLIFTIILSFFAFTVFGIVDALGQWNRAESVYQAMTLQNQKTIAFRNL